MGRLSSGDAMFAATSSPLNHNLGARRARVRRGAAALAIAVMGGLLAAVPAAADFPGDYKNCFWFDFGGGQRVAACTRVIDAGRLRGHDLAGAYNWRGEGYR